jgi:hypothetical protein
LLLVIAASFVVMYPWIFWGMVSSHDRPTHLYYFQSFYEQFRSGEFYPRWLATANSGAGSPIFFIQYPLPFLMATAFQILLHLPDTAGGHSQALALVFVAAAVLIAVGVYLWCSRFSSRWVAAFAALAGLTSPYVMSVDFYTRAAVGECLALAWIAFALYFSHDLETRTSRAVAGIALSILALFVSHLFSVIIFVPILVVYVLAIASPARRVFNLFWCGVGLGLAGLAASSYLLPILTYNRYFNLDGLMRQGNGVFFYDNQLIPIAEALKEPFPSGWWFLNWVILAVSCLTVVSYVRWMKRGDAGLYARVAATVVLCTILVSIAAPYLGAISFLSHHDSAEEWIHVTRSHFFALAFLSIQFLFLALLSVKEWATTNRLFVVLFATSFGCYLMMTRWTAVVWHHAHFLWSLQFPWRFFGVLSVFAAGLLALWLQYQSERGKVTRALLTSVCVLGALAVMGLVGWKVPVKFFHPATGERDAMFDMALPTYLRSSELYGDLNPWHGEAVENGTIFLRGSGSAEYQRLSSRSGRLTARCDVPCSVQLHLIYFPPWHAEEANVDVPISASARTGLATMDLAAGSHTVDLTLPKSATEKYGLLVSLFGVLGIGMVLLQKKRIDHRTPASMPGRK